MKGICALYETEADLRESHIFPKFVINHTKKTGSKYLRKIVEPNKRMQDGEKLYLLSEKAEQKFSLREKWFAENIFTNYLAENHKLPYTEELYYFAISFLWRALLINIKTEDFSQKWHYEILLKAAEEWRQFLANGTFPRNYENAYLMFTDRIESHNTGLKGVDFYMTRAMDATIVSNRTQTFLAVYGKFNRFIFWSVLKKFGEEEKIDDALINPILGEFKIPQILDYYPISSFLSNRIEGISKFHLPNTEQQSKIEQEILKNPTEFWNSDLGKSLYNDHYNLNS